MVLTLRLDVSVPSVFGKAQLLAMTRELAAYENKWAKDLQKKARVYAQPTAAQRAGRGYKRTYRLRRGWKVDPARFVGQDLSARVHNETPYAMRVQGDEFGRRQGPYHVNRWTPFRDIAVATDFARGAQDIITRNIRSATFRSSVNP